MTGCNGKCCERFPVGLYTLKEIQLLASGRPEHKEYQKLDAMLVVISTSKPNGHPGDLFSCRHFDPASRLCADYVNRPLMCILYPYEQTCIHCWLTLSQINNRELSA